MTTSPSTTAVRPAALRPGDRVAVISPSWGGAGSYPERFDRAIGALAGQLSLTGLPTRHACGNLDWRSARATERADDINGAFRDETIAGLMCAIGGDHAAQVLPLLDWAAIAARPKVFCGYSDATVLHHAIYAVTGTTTFYGPAVLAQFGEWPDPDEYTVEHFRSVAMNARPAGPVPRAGYVVDESGDWAGGRPRSRYRRPARPRTVLRAGSGSGPLLAGCLPSARQLLGTPWQPTYDGHVLVIETPPDYFPANADRDLTHLRNAGCLDELAALVVGRPPRLPEADRQRLHEVVLEAAAGFDYPVVAEFECGHTDPVATLPIGVACAVDGDELILLDSAVAP